MAQSSSLLEKELRQGGRSAGAGWPWHLLIFMSLIVGLFLLLYAGMTWGYVPYLESQVGRRDAEIKKLISLGDEKTASLSRFYSKLANAQILLKEHAVGTRILDLVENNLHPTVYLTGADIQSVQRTARLSGIASSYDAVGQQLALLRKQPGVISAFLEDSSLREQGDVRFTIRLIMKPSAFRETGE